MSRHKFSVTHWTYDSTTSTFTVAFCVANQETEHVEFHKVPIPYTFEDPYEFAQKVQSVITMYIMNLRRLQVTKMKLMDLTWSTDVPESLIDINTIQE